MLDTAWSAQFQDILGRHLPLCAGAVPPTAPLADLGLDSLGTVSLVMELEDGLGICLPDSLLAPATFQTGASLWAVVAGLVAESSANAVPG